MKIKRTVTVYRLQQDLKLMSRIMTKAVFGFLTRSNTHRAVQSQMIVRGLKIRLMKKIDCTIYVAKMKALIS